MIKKFIRKIPFLGSLAIKIKRKISPIKFESTEKYWVDRYKNGGNSGQGSYNQYAEHKAEVINDFVKRNKIASVIEFGSGDGNQLKYFDFQSYIGYEVSPPAIELCREMYQSDKTKSFYHMNEYANQTADLTLSLDVIYCLVEDKVYEDYIKRLFDASCNYVLIFSSNHTNNKALMPHMNFRKFTDWVEKNRPDFELIEFIENKYSKSKDANVSDFYFYKLKK